MHRYIKVRFILWVFRQLALVLALVKDMRRNDFRIFDFGPSWLLEMRIGLRWIADRLLLVEWRRFLYALVQFLVWEVGLENLDGVVPENESRGLVLADSQACVDLPFYFYITQYIDLRVWSDVALLTYDGLLSLVFSEVEAAWLGVAKGWIEIFSATRLTALPSSTLLHLLQTLWVHQVKYYVGRGRLHRVGDSKLVVFCLFKPIALKIIFYRRDAVLLELILYLKLLISRDNAGVCMGTELTFPVKSTRARSFFDDVCLIDTHRIVASF